MHSFSLKLPDGKFRHYTLPDCWEDLTPTQWSQVERVLHDSIENYPFALLMLWSRLTLAHMDAMQPDQHLGLLALLDWLQTPPAKWMRPRLRVGIHRFFGPGDGLEKMSFGAFLFAEEALKQITAGDLTALPDLAAACYVPRTWNGQPKSFSMDALAERATLMNHHLAGRIAQGIHYNYVGARANLVRTFERVFQAAKDATGDPTSWLDVGLSLARQTGALGTYAQLEQTNVYLVLTTLQALIEEADKLKES
ncbi:hypothetical protein [Fibrella forsythiae]|uniref:Uncharacterized protein n=1 Tax=Fibrella forsythiae TaxID=2817061 RepID=A0ABS3JDJ0_9BACT|nr:hypothetical protein [Fibrella forsythiae]MBO0946952.1 hypothetical protein [Fibrella forsythiae]